MRRVLKLAVYGFAVLAVAVVSALSFLVGFAHFLSQGENDPQT